MNRSQRLRLRDRDQHNLAVGQAMEIDAIFAGWKANCFITTVTRRQEKVLELMRELDKVQEIRG